MNKPLVIVHVVFRFDYGGLENGVVNLVNQLSADSYIHIIVALTEATDIQNRLTSTNVRLIELKKRPGKDLSSYVRLFKILLKEQPDIMHTRNVGTIDCQLIAKLAGIPRRIHSEHGWDTADPRGLKNKYIFFRRFFGMFVDSWVVLSREIEAWLIGTIRVNPKKISRITNGVDTHRFIPAAKGIAPTRSNPAVDSMPSPMTKFVSVTRFSEIKDPIYSIRAFIKLKEILDTENIENQVTITMIGDGPLLPRARALAEGSAFKNHISFPGSLLDVSPSLREMDVFVLGSKREGISNTILEAMASGLPCIVTRTGGNPELIEDKQCGRTVELDRISEFATAMYDYVVHPELIAQHSINARRKAETEFALERMVERYDNLYRNNLEG